jgi:hypothetical protein
MDSLTENFEIISASIGRLKRLSTFFNTPKFTDEFSYVGMSIGESNLLNSKF